jgi:Tfp pilus assembly protein PilO
MKLSRTSWLIIIFGVFIIVLVGLIVIRFQQTGQRSDMNDEVITAKMKLDGIQIEPLEQRQAELEQQLNQVKAQSETARTALSQPIESITISDLLFDIAEANSANITSLSSSGLASAELVGVICSTLPLSATVEGSVTDLANFITQMNGELSTGILKSVEINVPETNDEAPSASIELVIYSYKGG